MQTEHTEHAHHTHHKNHGHVSKPATIWILGGPGSGKGTQCKSLTDKHPGHFCHISTGNLLREATQVPTPEHAEII